MIRKLLIPAACAALLGGCATGYGYNDGGYYYGRPSVQSYGGVGYGSGYYDGYPYSSYYGSGYPYSSYGYGYGGYPYYRRPIVYYPRGHYRGDGHDHRGRDHDGRGHDGRDHDRDNDGRPPWRGGGWSGRGDRDGNRNPDRNRPGHGLPIPGSTRPSNAGTPSPRPRVESPARPRPDGQVRREALQREIRSRSDQGNNPQQTP